MSDETIDVSCLTSPAADEATVVYAVGDIHGRVDLLDRMEAAIADDIRSMHPTNPLICYLGDYIDRGPHSAEVIERLCGPFDDDVARIFLKGNHEDRMIAFFVEPAKKGPVWMQFGGRNALKSYGIDVRDSLNEEDDWAILRDALVDRLPDKHRAFLANLRLGLVWRDYLFVHAGLHPDAPLARQSPRDMMWIREPFLSSKQDLGLKVVHGHTIVDEPVFRFNRIGIDTGAYQSGKLTCLVAGASGVRILQVKE